MAREQVATYLNDHLAGSSAGLELLEHLESAHAGTQLEGFFAQLRNEVMADRKELESLMSRLGIAQSHARKATAWIAEKMTEVKLWFDDPANGALRLMEGLEALSLGIEGKRSLWKALAAASEDAPWLQVADYDLLAKRAEEQRSRVEALRLEAAREALLSDAT